jgi:hypothetical protein
VIVNPSEFRPSTHSVLGGAAAEILRRFNSFKTGRKPLQPRPDPRTAEHDGQRL